MASVPCDLSKDCPIAEAPGCFRHTLIRALELGKSAGCIPTGLDGFVDYFCRGCILKAGPSAQEIVDHWIRDHPRIALIREVISFATEVGNKMLSDDFNQLLQGNYLALQ